MSQLTPIRRLVTLLLGVLLFSLVPAMAQQDMDKPNNDLSERLTDPDPKEINFGIITTESTDNLSVLWTPFIADMSRITGLKVHAFFATDYSGVIEAMRFGQVQVAWFSNKSGLEAVRRAHGEVFAKSTYPDGAPGYYSVLIVPKDSPLKTVDDILKCDKSLNLGMGDPNSTSGTLVPMAYIFAPRGIKPNDCFKNVRNASHEANSMAVANKLVDVATNNTTNLQRLEITRPKVLDRIRVIWKSPLIQTDPIIWRKDLDKDVKEKVLYFFMTYGRRAASEKELQRQRQILANLDFGTFLPANNHHLDPIIRMEIVKDMAQAENDPKLSDANRAGKVAELKAKLAKMDKESRAATTMPKPQAGNRTGKASRGSGGFHVQWARLLVTLIVGIIAFGLLLWSSAPKGAGPVKPMKERLFDACIWSTFVAVMVWAYIPAEIFKAPLLYSNGDKMGEYIMGFLHPDFHEGWLYLEEMSVTIQIAIWGTFLSVIFAIPFGLLSARNVAPAPVVFAVRRLMDAFRSINELVVGTMFVVTVGLGPFAGVMALAVHTTGVLAKLFSEAVEAMDPGPVEGVRATGARRLHEVVWGVIPQVGPLWTSYALYRFESNVRSATILGLIGAGGIGQLLFEQIRSFQYGKTAAILLIIIVAVTLVDSMSQVLRKRLM